GAAPPQAGRRAPAGAGGLAGGVVGVRVIRTARGYYTSDWLNQLLGHFSSFRRPLVPAHWMAEGILEAARGDLESMAYYLALVWSNGLFFCLVTAWVARRLYRRGFNRVATGGTLRRRYGGVWMDRLLGGVVRFVHRQTRLLLVKDFRTFRRDPAQWAQI